MERKMLLELNFLVSPPTAFSFYRHFAHVFNAGKRVRTLTEVCCIGFDVSIFRLVSSHTCTTTL